MQTIINTTNCEHAESLLKLHKKDMQIIPSTKHGEQKQSWIIMNQFIQMAGHTNPITNETTIEGYQLTISLYKSPEICPQ